MTGRELIRGIIAAPVLPMTEEFEPDWMGLRHYLRWLVPQGPTAVAMNMDAAEGPSLSLDERLRVIEVSREAADGRCPVWSGLIAGSTKEAVQQAQALARAGAQGLAVFPPVPAFMGERCRGAFRSSTTGPSPRRPGCRSASSSSRGASARPTRTRRSAAWPRSRRSWR
jgi:Dihydrodipicolinate synthetase family